ncbi:MAG: DUF1998 domain-containing protein [Clostridiales bacterium]|jgi:hypothetical protein|nr:DUF1998 domain-containing protein [Clostridiales bacterium]
MPRPRFNNTKKPKKTRIAGDVRQYQLISSYGIGSIVDFAKDTVMIAGVDDWDLKDWDIKDSEIENKLFEDRKLFNENLQAITGAEFFLSPKTDDGSPFLKSKDIPSYVFPEMLYCPKCKHLTRYNGSSKCLFNNEKGYPCRGELVASRFVVCCDNGHIEDFPYSWWVHRGAPCASGKEHPNIKMFNASNRSDAASLILSCEDCGKNQPLESAFRENAFSGANGYKCTCCHPHLPGKRRSGETQCDAPLKTRLRSSSGVYFPVSFSALSIQPKKPASAAIKDRTEADVYFDEYKVLSRNSPQAEDEYKAHPADVPEGFEKCLKGVTVIDKLTVIQALKGFTRLRPWHGQALGSSEDLRIAPLSDVEKPWLPGIKLNGEGIFFGFSKDAITDWEKRVGDRYDDLIEAFDESLFSDANPRFQTQYVALHTFAHLMIRQLSNECGYSASSLKEKIYSTFAGSESQMHGVLIYLATSDNEGSLGGLISIAEDKAKLKALLEGMLRKAQWCSADPLCVSSRKQGFLSLNYAACHDCVLLPETSCEFRNTLLDRVSIVGMPESPMLGLFGECLLRL